MKKILLLTAFFFCYFQFLYSQGGIPDSSFGTNGLVTADLGTSYNYPFSANKVLANSHGSIYIITKTYIAKRLPNGLTDSSYGQHGFISASKISVNDAALQKDGKIVEVGTASGNFAIVRYNTNGSPDTAFNKNGSVITKFNDFFGGYINSGAKSIAIQEDGKIVAAGYTVKDGGKYGLNYTLAIARYNTNGSLDKSFSNDGKLMLGYTGAANSVAIEKDGKIVLTSAASYYKYFAISRISKDGSTDTTFGDEGWFQGNFEPNLVAIRTDGKIVVSGAEFSGNILAAYNTNGNLDSTFSEDGMQTTDFLISSFILQNNNKLLVAGDYSLARYNASGIPDSSFNENGIQKDSFLIASAAFDIDKKIVTTGTGFARYNNDGSVDNAFNNGGNLPVPKQGNTVFTKVKAQTDGKIVAAGTTWIDGKTKDILVLYNTNGSLDSTFSDGGIKVTRFPITSLVIFNNGKIVVTGDSLLARYNTDGSLDSSYGKDGIQHNDFAIQAAASQSDGKIVVVGSSSATDDSGADYPGFAVARYNTLGRLDSSFSDDGKLTELFYSPGQNDDPFTLSSRASLVGVQSNGKIVVAGSASGYSDLDNYANSVIVRFNPDGSSDSTFSGNIGSQGFEYQSHPLSMDVGSDGNIVVTIVTYSPDYNDVSVKRLGTNNFTVHLPYLNFQNSLVAIQDDGKTIVKGDYLLRLKANGTTDTGFGIEGQQTTEGNVSDITIENNKLITAGAGNNPGNVGIVARYLLDNKSNSSPAVSLVSPADKATYLAPAAHIKLSVAASDSDGTITKVEFYSDTTLLHTETLAPYGYVWKNVPLGNYTLTAKAYDNSGNVTTSAPVHISVVPNKPPVVSIIKPVNNQVFAAPANVCLEAVASDTDGRITRVEFFKDSTLLRTEYKFPYTYNWSNVPAGVYTITAKATDNYGAHTTSTPVTITVSDTSTISNRLYSKTGKTALNDALSLKLSPNPVSNIVNIYLAGLKQNRPATISIISVSGIVLKTMQISNSAIQLDVSSLTSGVYTLKIVSGDKILYKQFVKL